MIRDHGYERRYLPLCISCVQRVITREIGVTSSHLRKVDRQQFVCATVAYTPEGASKEGMHQLLVNDA